MTAPTTPVTGEALTKLAELLASATGPDRELDCLIAVTLDGFFELPPRYDGDKIGYGYTSDDGVHIHPGYGGDQLVRKYTASIEAALALVTRRLPDSGWSVAGGHMNAKCTLWPFSDKGDEFEGTAETTPIAIVAALVAALPPPHQGE